MEKTKKIGLFLSVFFCINYSIYILFDFTMITSFIQQHSWLENLYAFSIGVCGFINILSLQKDE